MIKQRFFTYTLATLAVVTLVQRSVARVFIVRGSSMIPTLMPPRILLVNTVTYRLRPPRRGDIVALHDPREPSRIGVKRVVALPGETIAGGTTGVTIDGVPLGEPYAAFHAETVDIAPQLVPPGHVFVLGDNRATSVDSRHFHAVPYSGLVGPAWIDFSWPGRRA